MDADGRAMRRGPARLAVGAMAAVLVLGACSSSSDDGDADAPADGGVSTERVDGSFDKLDEIVETVMAETGVPGVAAAVVSGDEVVYEQGYGVRNTETEEPVEPETVFQIASMSKSLSSTIMSGLVGDGVIAWDDPIVEYAPQFRLSDSWVADHVTFADLFSHRSGLPGGPAGNDLEALGYNRDTILEQLRLVPLDPFRITYSYSNFGMTLGGEAAAIAADSTWADVSESVLFEPAGMTSTSMRHADYVDRENRADLHVEVDGEWVAEFERQPDPQAPAGGGSSNVVDLARWMRLQLAEGSLDGEQIIDADALDQTHTPQVLKNPPAPTIADPSGFYGLGWNIGIDATGATRWDHSGAFSVGASTTVKVLPAYGVGIVVLTNGAPIGVPEAITDAYLEYLQTGDVDVDAAIELWAGRFGGLYGEPVVDVDDPPADPAPARDDAAYVGTYANDYVGEVEVRAGDDGLELVLGPDATVFALEHWDGDSFLYVDAPEVSGFPSLATFEVDDGDEATALTLSSLDGADMGTLTRV